MDLSALRLSTVGRFYDPTKEMTKKKTDNVQETKLVHNIYSVLNSRTKKLGHKCIMLHKMAAGVSPPLVNNSQQ